MGKAENSFKNIAEKKGFAVGVMQEREKAKFGKVGREIDDTLIRTDSGEGKEHQGSSGCSFPSPESVDGGDYVDGGHERVGGDNGMEEGIDI